MDKLELKKIILNRIEKPRIPARDFDAAQFGICSDSDAIQTEYLQHAIDHVSEQGGGRLILPAGRYRTGALQLKSGVELHLKSDDTVLAFVNENPESHYPIVFSHWESTPCYNFSPLIYACDAHDIALTGTGILDGGADAQHWWNWHHQVENAWSLDKEDLQLEDRKALRQMNLDGVPVEKRVFGFGHYLRPNFVQPIRCERVLFQGFTLHNSPMWQLNPVMCKSLTVDHVTMSSHGANNDGCDPESCSGVHILNCCFDTGDDCISLKSGRDRDGRIANSPCEDVLIEKNEFADGHGGIALGSEMSGGIRRVLAVNNHFSSPNLTYALRLKTNARRGGTVEDIVFADSVMECVHGAAVHGTMMYEDGRNGNDLPVFRNITIENMIAHGGDYGIFLEAFEEVPITGLVLRNIQIDAVSQPMRSMNWKEPVLENITINGKAFPRPCAVRILGIPMNGKEVCAAADYCGGRTPCHFVWLVSQNGDEWTQAGSGVCFRVPENARHVCVRAEDERGNTEVSRVYRVLLRQEAVCRVQQDREEAYERMRLLCRGMLDGIEALSGEELLTRGCLAKMLLPLADRKRRFHISRKKICDKVTKFSEEKSFDEAMEIAVGNGFLALDIRNQFFLEGYVTRQEMATVAMQACGVNYRNASSTMPICADAAQIGNNYGTNVARALYFGFMKLEPDGCFEPERLVTVKEAEYILNRVADFAGI